MRPTDRDQVREAIAWAVAEEEPLALQGAGTKAALGRPLQTAQVLDLSALAGVNHY